MKAKAKVEYQINKMDFYLHFKVRMVCLGQRMPAMSTFGPVIYTEAKKSTDTTVQSESSLVSVICIRGDLSNEMAMDTCSSAIEVSIVGWRAQPTNEGGVTRSKGHAHTLMFTLIFHLLRWFLPHTVCMFSFSLNLFTLSGWKQEAAVSIFP